MSDNYEFSKSCAPQGIDRETPYANKQFNYVNDINNGIYSNSGLTLVQFDLSSIFNSSTLIDISQSYIAIPITYVTAYSAAGTLTAPAAGEWAQTGLKCGFFQLVHGADLTVAGKTLEQFQPNLNVMAGIRLASQMSDTDLLNYGPTLGMGTCLDNWQSMVYNGSGVNNGTGYAFPRAVVGNTANPGCTGTGGNGMTNNCPFPFSNAGANFGDQNIIGAQFANCYNNGLYSRMKRIIDITSGNSNQVYNGQIVDATRCITNPTNFAKEFRPYYTVNGLYYQTVYDVAIIRCCDIFDSLAKMPMTKKFDGILRLYINTGTVSINTSVHGTADGLMQTSATGISFTNTNPLIVSCIPALPASVNGIVSGLFVGSPTPTAVSCQTGTVNLATSAGSHFMTACRFYFPQITLRPEIMSNYITENRAKRMVYTSFLTNTFSNISAASTVNYLVQSGVTAPRCVWIIPFISASTHGSITTQVGGVSPFAQALSPFDTAPFTNGPLSLLNLNVSVGGVNVLNTTLNYGYELFLEQFALYDRINASDMGLTCGLLSQTVWENMCRWYLVDCSRSTLADQLTPRNINVTFTNNTLQSLDCLILTEYFTEATIDVETGLIQK